MACGEELDCRSCRDGGRVVEVPAAAVCILSALPGFETFGLLCPGCGATRAAAALLHGHLIEALHWNALFVAALVTLMFVALVKDRREEWGQPPVWMVASGIAVAAAFGIARNL